jgi:hypothetical protein
MLAKYFCMTLVSRERERERDREKKSRIERRKNLMCQAHAVANVSKHFPLNLLGVTQQINSSEAFFSLHAL